jgi:hypothetical protein
MTTKVVPNYSPINIDLFFSAKMIGGQQEAPEIIANVPNISEYFISDIANPHEVSNIEFQFTDNNKTEDGINYYFAKGRNSAVYRGILQKTRDHIQYLNQNIVLKIIDEDLDSTIVKYNELVEDIKIKNCLPDILWYGKIRFSLILYCIVLYNFI